MKKRWVIGTIIVILLFSSAIFALSRKSRGNIEVKTTAVKQGDIIVSYSTNGAVESRSKREYFVQAPTKITKLRVKVGDRVKRGDIIADLDAQDLSIQLKTAEKQYENAKINLEKTREAYNKQKEQANQAQPPLIPGSNVTPSLTGAPVTENDIKLQENQVEIARLNVEGIKQNMAKQQRTIKSDIDGIITAVNGTEGGMTSVQLPLAVVENTSDLQVVLNVNQYDITNIKEGQEANVKFNNQSVRAVVDRINPTATKVVSAAGSDTTIKVILKLEETNELLKSGFEVDADIKVGEKKNVLKLPAEAIISDKEGNERVYILENNTVKLKNIKTGLVSDVEVEVLEGLKLGEKVVLNPSPSLRDGIQVVEKGVK